MRRALWSAILLLGACTPEPDLVLPLKVPVKILPEPLRQNPALFPKARQLSDADAEQLFKRILGLHLAWSDRRKGEGVRDCGVHDSLLLEDWHSHLLEARLFARAYPDLAERLAVDLLEDADLEPELVRFLLQMLSAIANRNSPRLEDLLVDLSEGGGPWPAIDALQLLSAPRRISRHRRLFYEGCVRGDRISFDLLAATSDPEIVRFLESLNARNPGVGQSAQAISFLCGEALYRIRLLDSPDCERKVAELLRGDPVSTWYWALGIAEQRFPVLARRALQPRVEEMRKNYGLYLGRSDEEGGVTEDTFVLHPSPAGVVDQLEWMLVSYGKAGGEWTAAEARRLAAFGFIGDPEEALLSILRRRRLW